MSRKLSYEELEQTVKELEKEAIERKRVEEELRESLNREQFLGDIIRNASVAIGVGYPDGRLGIFNPALQELTGYGKEELKTINWNTVLTPPEWREHETDTLEELHSTKRAVRYEKECVRKDGSRVPIELVVHPQFDDNENLESYVMFIAAITERRQAERALKKAEERQRKMFHESLDGAALADAETGILIDCNSALLELTGRERSELIGKSQKILHPPGEGDRKVSETFEQHRTDKEGQVLETRVITKTGEIKEVEIKAYRLELNNKKALLGVFRDISHQKRSEDELRERAKRYRTILESIEEGYYEVDLRGNLTFFNDSMCRILGYPREELMGMNNREYMSPETAKKVYSVFNRVYTTGKPDSGFDWEFVRKDGTEIHVETSLSLMIDEHGEATGFRGILRDVTERKRNEDALRESEERYRTILDSIEELYFEVDLQGSFTFFNDRMAVEVGYSRDELMGMNNRDYMTPESAKHIYELFNQMYRTGDPVKQVTYEIILKDGTHAFHELSASLMRDNTGQPIGFRGIAKDVTERKQAEEALKQRTSELEAAQKELVNRALEAGRAQLSAMVLHNIGNAITPIKVQIDGIKTNGLDQIPRYLEKCYLDLREHVQDLEHYISADPRGKEVFSFMGKLVDTLKEQSEKRASVIKKIDEAVSYISEILTFQQAYAAGGKETKERIDLNVLIEDAIHMQTGALEKRGITVQRKLDHDLPKLLIDKNKLMQVIVNFIKNSYEAIDELRDSGKERTIVLSSSVEDGKVSFEVKDNGVGIERQQLDTIFDYGNSKKGSSGFGLYYCKMFVDRTIHHP